MSGHGPTINEEMLKAMPAAVSRITQGILLAVGIVSMVISIAGEYSHGSHYLHSWLVENVTILSGILHLILVLLILFPGRIRLQNHEVNDRKVQSVIKCLNEFFVPAWTYIWVFFGLLYMAYLFTTLHPESSHAIQFDRTGYEATQRVTILMDVFNTGSTLFILLTFTFLTPRFLRAYVKFQEEEKQLPKTKAKDENKLEQQDQEAKNKKARQSRKWRYWKEFCWPLFIVAFITAWSIWSRASVLWFDNPAASDTRVAFGLGMAGALAIALFVGRMDSKFILNWQWVVPILFLYAAMQTYTNVLYEDVAMNKAVFTYSAFTMKCVLFIFVSNFFEQRRAIYYAKEVVDAGDRRV